MELDKRKCLLELWNNGTKNPKILSELTNTSLRACYNFKKRIESGKGVERSPGTGAPSKLMENDRRRILQLALWNPKLSTARIGVLAAEKGSPWVSKSTISRALKSAGYQKWTPKPIPMLTEIQKFKRVQWCQENLNRNWENVIFTDESTFQFHSNYLKVWAKDRPQKMTPKHGPSAMIWGGISMRGKTSLKLVTKTIKAVDYQDILEECCISDMNMLFPDGWILQQDNATPHTALSTKRFLEDNNIEVISWPASSPDLNIIENVWIWMKRELEIINPKNVGEWKAVIEQKWTEFPQDFIERFFEGLPRRLQECIAAGGNTINK